MIKVGITGGIGSGKTTACRLFEVLGIPVYYADPRAKWLMTYDKALKQSIKDLLGAEAYHRNGRLNRAAVAGKIFTDKALLQGLNALVHPAVGIDAQRWYAEMAAEGHPYALKEAALLVENGSYKTLDYLISVSAPEKLRIERVMARDGISAEQVEQRMSNQLPQSAKDEVADFIIHNDGKQSLIRQVWSIHRSLIGDIKL